jgi:DNA-binding GntR family transcriptional regulator
MIDIKIPVEAPSLADGVVRAIRDAIASRELCPEETYSVYVLAEVLGVSRSPVREGLLRLAEAGLVEIHRNRGFRVKLPRAKDVEEIFEIRQALEPASARRVAEAGNLEGSERLQAALASMDKAARSGHTESFWSSDRSLHDELLRLGGNARAAAIVAQLRATTALLGPPTTASGRSMADIVAEHRPIVDAVIDQDGAKAEKAMCDHLSHTAKLLIRCMT